METKLIVARHGETEWNTQGRVQGHLDSPLTDRGRRQSEALARAVAAEPIAAIYSSDLGRALDTAAPVARVFGLAVRTELRLRERHLGVFQGLTFVDAARIHPELHARYRARDRGERLLTGESLEDVRVRIEDALASIAVAHPDRVVLVVTHGGALDQIFRLATGMPLEAPRDFGVENASINRLRWSDGRLSLDEWGDVAHRASDGPGAEF